MLAHSMAVHNPADALNPVWLSSKRVSDISREAAPLDRPGRGPSGFCACESVRVDGSTAFTDYTTQKNGRVSIRARGEVTREKFSSPLPSRYSFVAQVMGVQTLLTTWKPEELMENHSLVSSTSTLAITIDRSSYQPVAPSSSVHETALASSDEQPTQARS